MDRFDDPRKNTNKYQSNRGNARVFSLRDEDGDDGKTPKTFDELLSEVEKLDKEYNNEKDLNAKESSKALLQQEKKDALFEAKCSLVRKYQKKIEKEAEKFHNELNNFKHDSDEQIRFARQQAKQQAKDEMRPLLDDEKIKNGILETKVEKQKKRISNLWIAILILVFTIIFNIYLEFTLLL